jgi:hypothetical protein
MTMSREEINALIAQKIHEHEMRIGIISGILGAIFFVALLSSLFFLYSLAVA